MKMQLLLKQDTKNFKVTLAVKKLDDSEYVNMYERHIVFTDEQINMHTLVTRNIVKKNAIMAVFQAFTHELQV